MYGMLLLGDHGCLEIEGCIKVPFCCSAFFFLFLSLFLPFYMFFYISGFVTFCNNQT